MIRGRAEWTTLMASAPGLMPEGKEARVALGTLREALTPTDVEELGAVAASDSGREQLAALWLLSFEVGSSLVSETARPQYIASLTTAFRRAEFMSDLWYIARNCLFDLEIEPDPLDEDLRWRGLTREQFLKLEKERDLAEKARRLPPVVPIEEAVEALLADSSVAAEVTQSLRENLRADARLWREERDPRGLAGVAKYILDRPMGTVPLRLIVDVLGAPDEISECSADYTTQWAGLALLARGDGRITQVSR